MAKNRFRGAGTNRTAIPLAHGGLKAGTARSTQKINRHNGDLVKTEKFPTEKQAIIALLDRFHP